MTPARYRIAAQRINAGGAEASVRTPNGECAGPIVGHSKPPIRLMHVLRDGPPPRTLRIASCLRLGRRPHEPGNAPRDFPQELGERAIPFRGTSRFARARSPYHS
jgi:hypothetical protein